MLTNKIQPLKIENNSSFYRRLNRLKKDIYELDKTYYHLNQSINSKGNNYGYKPNI